MSTLTRNSSLFANLKRTVDPVGLAVSVEQAKAHCDVQHDDHDSLLKRYIKVATAKVENDSRRGFINQTWQQAQDDFCEDLILLRRCPVSSVSSVAYTDTDGVSQTVSAANYQADTNSEPARLCPAYSVAWPSVRSGTLNGVIVTFIVGYGTDHTSLPDAATQAILYLVYHYYELRCPVVDAKLMPTPLGYEPMIQCIGWDP